MIALGVDLSVSKVAIGGIREDGGITIHAAAINPKVRGAHRLQQTRSVAHAVLAAYRSIGVIVLVEEPPNVQLRAMASVVQEAAQTAIPGAIVEACGPTKWKLEALGYGAADKPACLDHARLLGYDGDDQDIAEALCMADAAWGRYNALGRAA